MATAEFPAARRALVVRFSQLVRWDVAFFRAVRWQWREEVMRPVGDALHRRHVEVEKGLDTDELPIIEKISFGGVLSVTAPEARKGYRGRLFWADVGDLIYSKIRAKQGSLCVVPSSVGRVAVSAEYPVYSIRSDVVDPRYLAIVLRSAAFLDILVSASHGGSTKTRIPPEEFERLRIPLPPLGTQRNIVAAWQASRSAAAATAAEIARRERDIDASFLTDLGLSPEIVSDQPKVFALRWSVINRWGVGMAWRETTTADTAPKYPMVPLGNLCKSGSGGTPSRLRKEYFGNGASSDVPWVKTTEVRGDVIETTEETLSPEGLANSSAKIYPAGSIVIAMYGQGATRGRSAKLGIDAATNQACLILHNFNKSLDPDYAWYYLTARYHHLRELGSGNNQPNLSAEIIRDYPIVLPPLTVQEKLVERVEHARIEIAKLKADAAAQAETARTNIEAMILGINSVKG